MTAMQARCYCQNHGRLEFDEIAIKQGLPVCIKCSSILVFGTVKPRKLVDNGHK